MKECREFAHRHFDHTRIAARYDSVISQLWLPMDEELAA
jgi:hypothetical protein